MEPLTGKIVLHASHVSNYADVRLFCHYIAQDASKYVLREVKSDFQLLY